MFFLGVRGFLFGNFRILVIASEAKQSLGILNLFLGILDFYPRNSRILYYVILGLDPRISIRNFRILCDEIPRSSRGMTQGLGILEFLASVTLLPRNDTGNSRFIVMRSPCQAGG